ncbi:MAG: CocE/NonD family hydrolase [Caldilineaceae bacterium]
MNILIEKNLQVSMRDGVLLATDLYRSAQEQPAPVLVRRTPYNKERFIAPDVMAYVQAGYHVVIQDARGRFASQGEFNAGFQEVNDSADCYAWVAQQPWCDGRIGTLGESYMAQLQWLSAAQMPKAVKALSTLIAPIDHYSDIAYRGGVLNIGSMLFWCSMMALGEQERRLKTGRATPQAMMQQAMALANLKQIYETLPLSAMSHLEGISPHFFNWLSHPTYDEFWQGLDARKYAKIDKPVLHIGGWYDIFLNGNLQAYIGMQQRDRAVGVSNRQKLIIGPWSHGTNWTSSYHEMDYGMHAGGEAVNLTGVQQRWMDRWVKGIENGIEQESPVRIFVMGINQWRDEADWPLPDTQYTPFYLHSDGHANTLHGDGTLSTTLPDSEPADRFVYDPLNPVPSIGGANLMPYANAIGPRDQQTVEVREDVLVFSTEVLSQAVEVTGPVTAQLYVSSSVPDTDITCKLVDVYPDGRAMLLTDGILRLRYRHSFSQPTLLQPDEIVPITVDLWSTSNVFLPGHRIRIEVSSSCFPKFARNSNTGGDVVNEGREVYRSALNHIYHDAEHPSHVLLPIVERS